MTGSPINKGLRRVQLFGSLSEGLACTTLFAIFSGTLENGTAAIPVFAVAALLLVVLAFFSERWLSGAGRRLVLVLGVIVLLGALAGVWSIYGEHWLYTIFMVGSFGGLLLYRLWTLLEQGLYLRQVLLSFYKHDIFLLLLVAAVTSIMTWDHSWTTKMLPFFVLYLMMRMLALSNASQVFRGGNDRSSRWEKRAVNLPIGIVGVGLFGGWISSALGVSVFAGIGKVLSPLMYALGFLVQGATNGLLTPDRVQRRDEVLQHMGEGMRKNTQGLQPFTTTQPALIGEWTLVILVAIPLIGVLTWAVWRTRKRVLLRRRENPVEVREFIGMSDDKPLPKKSSVPLDLSGLTPLRKTYRRFLLAMQKAGHQRRSDMTPLELADAIARKNGWSHPAQKGPLYELTELYMEERYGGQEVKRKQQRAEQIAQSMIDDTQPKGNKGR